MSKHDRQRTARRLAKQREAMPFGVYQVEIMYETTKYEHGVVYVKARSEVHAMRVVSTGWSEWHRLHRRELLPALTTRQSRSKAISAIRERYPEGVKVWEDDTNGPSQKR